jgi:hypothetical protein
METADERHTFLAMRMVARHVAWNVLNGLSLPAKFTSSWVLAVAVNVFRVDGNIVMLNDLLTTELANAIE